MEEALHVLKKYWGYDEFRTPQQEIIASILEQKDTMALLPTGGGKSICYQIPMLMQEGIGLVISPLIALMEDQVNQLKNRNIKAIALTGTSYQEDINDLLDNCSFGNYKLLYISPERLQQEWIFERIIQLPISLIAVDEAHCVSQWGHDFRPSFLQIHKLRNYLSNVPMVALTASANDRVEKDIIEQLQLKNVSTFKKSFLRTEISYITHLTESIDETVFKIFSKSQHPGIVYVRNRRKTVELAQNLTAYGITSAAFHGGLSYRDKKNILQNWLDNEIQVIVATNAFGMGIDKPDVRNVVHIQIPENLESYYQEAGRAGRDGKNSKAILLYNDFIVNQYKTLFEQNKLDGDFLKKLFKHFVNDQQIAYGEGYGQEFNLNFSDFCEKHNLPFSKTYAALEFLDRQGVITIKQEFHYKSYIHFLWDNDSIIQYFKSKPIEEKLFLFIIHNYRGVSEIETTVNIKEISKKTMYSEDVILRMLEEWQKMGICTFKRSNHDTKIILNEIREDDITINRTIKYLKQQNEIKVQQHLAMLDYVTQTDTCKSMLILTYFGQESEPCNQCSVCKNKQKKNTIEDFENKLFEYLLDQTLAINEVAEAFKLDVNQFIFLIEPFVQNKQLIIEHNHIKRS